VPYLRAIFAGSMTKNRNDPICVISPKVAKARTYSEAVSDVFAKIILPM